jgi:uncharacterized repeat protein (TIGR03803 family)
MFTNKSALFTRTLIAIGASVFCAGAAMAAAPAYGPKTIYSFSYGPEALTGTNPVGAPAQGLDGNYYGATASGGANGDGTLYQLTPGGQITTLHSFDYIYLGVTNGDGSGPLGPLAHDKAGTFYGATWKGGEAGTGVVFSITPSGTFTLVHTFSEVNGDFTNADGGWPTSGLTAGPDGSVYGLTSGGGTGGGGVLYKVAPDGTFSVVHAFTLGSSTEGYEPVSLTVAPDGTIYGADAFGGPYLSGCIYKIATDGTFSVIYSFVPPNPADYGSAPMAMIVGNDGKTLYGVLNAFPSSVYKLTPDGQFTTLHTASAADGWTFGNADGDAYNSLVMAADGTLYVTAEMSGPFAGVVYPYNWIPGGGSLLQISPDGQAVVLHFFGADLSTDGFTPEPLQLDSDGTLWGATQLGGANTGGIIYTMPLPPPAHWNSITPTVTATITPQTIYANSGKTATLRWKSTNAGTCYVVGTPMVAGQEVAKSGSMTLTLPTVKATTDFNYQVSCTAGGKSAEASATLTVKKL